MEAIMGDESRYESHVNWLLSLSKEDSNDYFTSIYSEELKKIEEEIKNLRLQLTKGLDEKYKNQVLANLAYKLTVSFDKNKELFKRKNSWALDNALNAIKESIEICKSLESKESNDKNKFALTSNLLDFAEFLIDLKKPEEALPALKEMIDINWSFFIKNPFFFENRDRNNVDIVDPKRIIDNFSKGFLSSAKCLVMLDQNDEAYSMAEKSLSIQRMISEIDKEYLSGIKNDLYPYSNFFEKQNFDKLSKWSNTEENLLQWWYDRRGKTDHFYSIEGQIEAWQSFIDKTQGIIQENKDITKTEQKYLFSRLAFYMTRLSKYKSGIEAYELMINVIKIRKEFATEKGGDIDLLHLYYNLSYMSKICNYLEKNEEKDCYKKEAEEIFKMLSDRING